MTPAMASPQSLEKNKTCSGTNVCSCVFVHGPIINVLDHETNFALSRRALWWLWSICHRPKTICDQSVAPVLFLNSRCWPTMKTVAELLAYPEIPIHCTLAKTQHAKHLGTIVSHWVKSYHEFGQKYHLPKSSKNLIVLIFAGPGTLHISG